MIAQTSTFNISIYIMLSNHTILNGFHNMYTNLNAFCFRGNTSFLLVLKIEHEDIELYDKHYLSRFKY